MIKSQRMNIKTVCEYLQKHDDYLILTHALPDGDTLGSAYALCSGLFKLGKRAKVACADKLPSHYDYFTTKVKFPQFEEKTVISVDVADSKLLGKLEQATAGKIELAIDHHASHRDFAKRLYLDAQCSAASECVYDILTELGVELDSVMAQALYTGIATDTGCFKFSNTTPRTHIIASRLMECGIDFAEINRIMFDTKSKARMEIEKAALGSVELCFDDTCAVMSVTRKMMRDSGCSDSDMDGITAIPRSIEGVLVGVTIRQRQGKNWKISMRSYPPIDVSKICGKMNGGGHAYAAGCELNGTLKQVKTEILKHVKKALEDSGAGNNTSK